jgi:hypothetical protein
MRETKLPPIRLLSSSGYAPELAAALSPSRATAAIEASELPHRWSLSGAWRIPAVWDPAPEGGDHMDARQKEQLLFACDAILDSDTEGAIGAIIVWPDVSKPSGVGTIVLGEGNGQSRQGDAHYVFAENEDAARHILAVRNAAAPWPLIPLGH